MPRGNPGIPQNIQSVILRKRDIFAALKRIDADESAKDRILRMESDFRTRIDSHLDGLPQQSSNFQKFNTSPFVLTFYSRQQGYQHVSQIENAIVPAKVFSSMETSAGRMVEAVALPVYGWETVPSTMHSVESVLDGCKRTNDGTFMAATLKSGPRCLNDEMAKDIGVDVVRNSRAWMASHQVSSVEFTYGVLYGTKKQSNKKDWHILRNIHSGLPASSNVTQRHEGSWSISYADDNSTVSATVRVGIEWWTYLGGPDAWLELCVSLIRACITPGSIPTTTATYQISDLGSILDISVIPAEYNVALLQRSQYEWLLFLARHFCDDLR